MKGIKKVLVTLLIAGIVGFVALPTTANALTEAPPAVNQHCAKVEKKIRRKFKKVKFYTYNIKTEKELWKLITHRRKKKYNIVEVVYGQCINENMDGNDACGHYISYRGVKGIKKGDWVFTYLVYRRGNNYCDDVIARYDVISRR